MDEIAVKVEDLTIAYYLKPVVWDVDLDIKKGKLTAIMGPNGAGKSTLLKAMLNLIPTSSGKISFFGKTYKEFRKDISYVPQSESVDWDFPTDVLDVVLMGTYGKLGWIKRPGKREKELSLDSLKKLRDNGKTIIIVHHDLRTVEEYFDEVVLLNKFVITSGSVKDVFTEENINKAYRV